MILSLYPDPPSDLSESERSQWIVSDNSRIYDLLIRIPHLFRTPEAQAHIDQWHQHFGYNQPSPEVHMWGGTVISPLSKENLLALSDEALLRLLHYYQKYPHRKRLDLDHDLIGGFSEIMYVLGEACSLHPMRFLSLFPAFIASNLHRSNLWAVVEGIAKHLRYRFGNLKPSSGDTWTPVEPLPDGKTLAVTLLTLLEQYPVLWDRGDTISQALEACCNVLDEPELADRLTLLLFWTRSKTPDDRNRETSINAQGLLSDALNSTQGVAANNAMLLCNRLLEREQPLPELLPCLLHHFARDPAIYVRIPILRQLPFLMYKRPELGWQLLADVFQEPQPYLWQFTERCLYHQYRDHFHQVAPYLERLLQEGMEKAGEIWGRISTLASLAGHIPQETLFDNLKLANADAWKGAAQVFVANVDHHEHTAVCHAGLITILSQKNLSSSVFREVTRCFDREKTKEPIPHKLALAFLNALSASTNGHDLRNFLEWLSHKASYEPLFALDLAERLAERLETDMRSFHIWHPQPLITTLNAILREADETDDPELVQRAINLQDRFFKLDLRGIEELFDLSGKS